MEYLIQGRYSPPLPESIPCPVMDADLPCLILANDSGRRILSKSYKKI